MINPNVIFVYIPDNVPLLISGRSNLVKSHHCSLYVVLAMLLATADCPSPIDAPAVDHIKPHETVKYKDI